MLSSTFSVTAPVRCAAYLASLNIIPSASQIFEGTDAKGIQPESTVANAYQSIVISYAGLTQNTAYHVYCAQGELISRLAYFTTRSAYCSVQPIGVREIDRRFYFSHPATRFIVAGTPIYERDPPSCSYKYKNSILLMFLKTFHLPLVKKSCMLRLQKKLMFINLNYMKCRRESMLQMHWYFEK